MHHGRTEQNGDYSPKDKTRSDQIKNKVSSNGSIKTSDKEHPTDNKRQKMSYSKSELESVRKTYRGLYRNLYGFVLVYALIILLRSCLQTFFFSVSQQIQNRHIFRNFEVNFIIGVEKIGFVITLLFIGYYGNKIHKPIATAAGGILFAIGAILCACPYFLYGADDADRVSMQAEAELCVRRTSFNHSLAMSQELCDLLKEKAEANYDAFSLLSAGQFLVGIGGALTATLGLLYVDENSERMKVPLLIGILLSMNGAGELIAAAIAAGVSSTNEDITDNITMEDHLTGAWWLGLLLIAGFLILVSGFALIFPRWIREPKWILEHRLNVIRRAERRYKKRQEKKVRHKHKRRNSGSAAEVNSDLSVTNQPLGYDNTGVGDFSDIAAAEPAPFGPFLSDEQLIAAGFLAPEETGNIPAHRDPNAFSDDQTPYFEDRVQNNVGNGELTDNNGKSREQGKTNGDTTASANGVIATSEAILVEHPIEEKKTENVKNDPKKTRKSLGKRLSDLPQNLWYLLTRVIFVLSVLGTSLSAYVISGFYGTMPDYINVEFYISRHQAFAYTNLIFGFAHLAGCVAGGFIVMRMKWSLFHQVRMLLVLLGVSVVVTLVVMALGCPSHLAPTNAKTKSISEADMNHNCDGECDCQSTQLNPICSQDGAMYWSSCHAGCTRYNRKSFEFSQCSVACVPGGGELSRQHCHVGCSTFPVFAILMCLVILLLSTGLVSVVIIFIRIVTEKLRSLSLGFGVWLIYLLAIVPGVAVYNFIGDTSCLLWRQNCFQEQLCWHRDNRRHSFAIIATTAVFLFASLLCFLAIWLKMSPHRILPERIFPKRQEEKQNQETDDALRDVDVEVTGVLGTSPVRSETVDEVTELPSEAFAELPEITARERDAQEPEETFSVEPPPYLADLFNQADKQTDDIDVQVEPDWDATNGEIRITYDDDNRKVYHSSVFADVHYLENPSGNLADTPV